MRAAALFAVLTLAAVGCGSEPAVWVPRLDTAHDQPVATGPRSGSEPLWISRPATAEEAAGKAQAGVIATVVAVEEGDPIVAAPDEVNPTQLVTLDVRDRWFGTTPDRIVISWLGTPGGGAVPGDPPYALGQDYILFLDRRGDGPWYRPESPDGRMQILDGRVVPVIDGPVGDDVRGRTPAAVKRAVTREDA